MGNDRDKTYPSKVGEVARGLSAKSRDESTDVVSRTSTVISRKGDRFTRRFVLALALIPIVPAVSFIGVVLLNESGLRLFRRASWDEVRCMHLIFAVLWTAGTILIWRRFVLWTWGRKWLTALVAVVPFVQVIWATPLWSSRGCFASLSDDFLQHGQHDFLSGLFIWLCIWIWWIGERRAMRKKSETETKQGTISPVAWRLVAGLGSIPIVVGLFIIAMNLGRLSFNKESLTFGYGCAAAAAVCIWVAIWFRRVWWTPGLVLHSIIIAAITLVIPILICWYLDVGTGIGRALELIGYTFPVIGYGCWMIWTMRVWPLKWDAKGAGHAVPHCPGCDYPLIGLTHTRCPECGSEPTLEELWREQAEV